jgi:hypothetical protein
MPNPTSIHLHPSPSIPIPIPPTIPVPLAANRIYIIVQLRNPPTDKRQGVVFTLRPDISLARMMRTARERWILRHWEDGRDMVRFVWHGRELRKEDTSAEVGIRSGDTVYVFTE